jgi:pimeloyl-ACP methyl ester carboxylesterase
MSSGQTTGQRSPAQPPAQPPVEHWIKIRDGGDALRLHVLEWPGDEPAFVLLHGLASNAVTWAAVGRELAAHGHRVVAVDQRGHGRSDKPESGYDFATVSDDLHFLLEALSINAPVIAGQSWGGNVVLAYGARYPQSARHLVFVDGGFLDLQARPDMTWERVATELRPPPLAGSPYTVLAQRIRAMHSDWTEEGVAATLENFEHLPDGTVRPWLTLDRHMAILRALWEQRPPALYPQIVRPVSIVVADDGSNPAWLEVKRSQVQAAQQGLRQVDVHWLADTAHDIHVHRPAALAALLLAASRQGR